MDIITVLQIVVLLIFLGVRMGGIGIGYAGGIGVLIPLCLDMKPGNIPGCDSQFVVISAISAMQLAGGLDYLVQVAERIFRKNPKYNYLAPVVTYVLTIFAGTGHTAFSMIPVIVEVSKEQNIKPRVRSQLRLYHLKLQFTASPVSAAVYMSGVLEGFGWSYPVLLGIWLFITFVGCMLTAFIISLISDMKLTMIRFTGSVFPKDS